MTDPEQRWYRIDGSFVRESDAPRYLRNRLISAAYRHLAIRSLPEGGGQ